MALQCKRCGSGMPDTADKCPTCSAPVSDDVQQAAPAGQAMPSPGIPGLPTPAPVLTPGIPGLPTPSAGIPGLPNATPGIPGLPNQPQQPMPNYLNPGAAPMGGAPMGGAPMGAPMAGGGGEIRVSLTGEVYEVPPPTPRGTGPGGYGAPTAPGRPGAPPLPTRGSGGPGHGPGGHAGGAGARPRYGIPTAAAEEKKGGVPIWALLVVLLLLGGGAGGGFWWWQKQQAPKKAAEKYVQAMMAENWDAVVDSVYIPADAEAQLKAMSPAGADTRSLMKMGLNMFGAMADFTGGKVEAGTISGDTAKVKITMTISAVGGQTTPVSYDASMRLVDGVWKVEFDRDGFNRAMGAGQAGGGNVTTTPGR